MNILIANNSKRKTEKLSELLYQIDKNNHVIGKASSIKETLHFFNKESNKIDVTFLETRLSDGMSFEIFNHVLVRKPIIFTSDSKAFAFEAIKADGIDYLLDPIMIKDVMNALDKVRSKQLRSHETLPGLEVQTNKYKKRFIVKFGDKIQYKNIHDISYFYAEGKLVYIITRSTNRKYIIEHTLDELEKVHLDQEKFFRINRKFIVNIEVIEEVRNYVNSRLKLILNPPSEMDMIVSREKVNDFRNWLNL